MTSYFIASNAVIFTAAVAAGLTAWAIAHRSGVRL